MAFKLQGALRLSLVHEPADGGGRGAPERQCGTGRAGAAVGVVGAKRLRPQRMRDPDLGGAVLRILLRVIRRELLRARHPSVRRPADLRTASPCTRRSDRDPSQSPLGLLDRLARLIPPPRVHRHRYHGVFAPNAMWRKEATRYGREDAAEAASDSERDGGTGALVPACGHGSDRGPRRRWARLLARIYKVHPLRCPTCHGEMRILAFLTEPGVVRPILRHLRIPGPPAPGRPRARAATDRADRGRSALALGPGQPSGHRPRPLRPEPPRRRRNRDRVSRRPECPGPTAACTPTAQPRIRRTHPRIRPLRRAKRPPHGIGSAERPSLTRTNLPHHIASTWDRRGGCGG